MAQNKEKLVMKTLEDPQFQAQIKAEEDAKEKKRIAEVKARLAGTKAKMEAALNKSAADQKAKEAKIATDKAKKQ